MEQHDWHFVGVPGQGNGHPGLIAVCSKCGTVRSLTVVVGGDDLTPTGGVCTG